MGSKLYRVSDAKAFELSSKVWRETAQQSRTSENKASCKPTRKHAARISPAHNTYASLAHQTKRGRVRTDSSATARLDTPRAVRRRYRCRCTGSLGLDEI